MADTTDTIVGLGAFLSFDVSSAVKSMGMAEAKIERLRHSFATLNAGVDRIHRGVTSATRSLALLAGGVGAAVGASTMEFAKFNDSLIKVGTLLDGGTAAAKEYRGTIENMSVRFGRTVEEISDGMFQTLSHGFQEGAQDIAETANKLATAGFIPVEMATRAVAGAAKAWGVEAKHSIDIADTFFNANKYGALEIEDLARYLGMASSTAAQAGISYKELSAALAVDTNQGMRFRVAATGMNQAVMNIIKPSQQAAKMAEELGIQFDVTTLRSMGLARFLDYVGDALTRAGKTEKERATLFGSIEGYRAIIPLMTQGRDEFLFILEKMADQFGLADQKMADVAKSYTFKINQLKQVARGGMRSIGEAFIDEFELSKVSVDGMAEKFKSVYGVARDLFKGLHSVITSLDLPGAFRSIRDMARDAYQWLHDKLGDSGMKRLAELGGKVFLLGAAGSIASIALSPLLGLISGIGGVAVGSAQAVGGLVQAVGLLAGKWRAAGVASAAVNMAALGSDVMAARAPRGAQLSDAERMAALRLAAPGTTKSRRGAIRDPFAMFSGAAPPMIEKSRGGIRMFARDIDSASGAIGFLGKRLGGLAEKIPILGSMGPVGLALAAAFGLVATNAGGSRDALFGLVGRVKDLFLTVKGGVEVLTPLGQALKGIADIAGGALTTAFQSASGALGLLNMGLEQLGNFKDFALGGGAVARRSLDVSKINAENMRRIAAEHPALAPFLSGMAQRWAGTEGARRIPQEGAPQSVGEFLKRAIVGGAASEFTGALNEWINATKAGTEAALIARDKMREAGLIWTNELLAARPKRVSAELKQIDAINRATLALLKMSNQADMLQTRMGAIQFQDAASNIVRTAGRVGNDFGRIWAWMKSMKIDLTNVVKIDGREAGRSVSKASLNLADRGGANVTPWQRLQILERGAVVTKVNRA